MSELLVAVSSDQVSAGPLGLLIVSLMMIATVLLIRNMSGRIKKLPTEFPPSGDDPEPKAAAKPARKPEAAQEPGVDRGPTAPSG